MVHGSVQKFTSDLSRAIFFQSEYRMLFFRMGVIVDSVLRFQVENIILIIVYDQIIRVVT